MKQGPARRAQRWHLLALGAPGKDRTVGFRVALAASHQQAGEIDAAGGIRRDAPIAGLIPEGHGR